MIEATPRLPACNGSRFSPRANRAAQPVNAMLNEFPERPGVINVILEPSRSAVVSWNCSFFDAIKLETQPRILNRLE